MQQANIDGLVFDLFYHDVDRPNDDRVTTGSTHPFNIWLCIEAIIDPRGASLMQLYVDGCFVGQIDSPPVAVLTSTYDLTDGPTRIEVPSRAATLHIDNMLIEKSAVAQCDA